MKIGILTQPLCNNYGGILQNYALQTVLRQMGHDPVTLDIPTPEINGTWIHLGLSYGKRSLMKLFGNKCFLYADPITERQKNIDLAFKIKQFVDKHIQRIVFYPPFAPSVCKYMQLDAYIVGSDQVWRPRYNRNLLNYFLDFAQDFHGKKVAYAASFGVDDWEMDPDTTNRARILAQKFDKVSVREASGVDLCSKYLNTNAIHVLDPTFLLTPEQYLSLLGPSERQTQDPYIGVYVLDMSSKKRKILSEISKRLKLPIVYIGQKNKKGFPSIEEWLTDIYHAQFMVTDSFHGTVFSIIFNKQFISIANSARGSARFDSLLNLFNLHCRLIDETKPMLNILGSDINYQYLKTILSNKRKESLQFLTNTLS